MKPLVMSFLTKILYIFLMSMFFSTLLHVPFTVAFGALVFIGYITGYAPKGSLFNVLTPELKTELDKLKSALEKTIGDKYQIEVDALKAQIKTLEDNAKAMDMKTVNETVESLKEQLKALKDAADANQPIIDKASKLAERGANQPEAKKNFGSVFGEQIAEAFESKKAEFAEFQKNRNAKLTIELKAVGNMTVSGNLTGEGQATYNTRQGLVPAHKINFRDLIPMTQSPTGIYVSYRETGTEGSISQQTEGAAKSQIDYDLTRVSVVSDYIAGYARFSKQMMYQLPWLQNTLPRLLSRDFFKKENSSFYATVAAAATGNAVVTPTEDIEQVIAWIANQLNGDFNPSFGIVNFTDWQNLLLTKPNDYSIPGGVKIDDNGNIRIAGVPIIGASWATADKMMLIDSDFIERVETESMRVEFSYEDNDNFTKNLVTARVECFEDLNLLRTDAHIYGDFGNVA